MFNKLLKERALERISGIDVSEDLNKVCAQLVLTCDNVWQVRDVVGNVYRMTLMDINLVEAWEEYFIACKYPEIELSMTPGICLSDQELFLKECTMNQSIVYYDTPSVENGNGIAVVLMHNIAFLNVLGYTFNETAIINKKFEMLAESSSEYMLLKDGDWVDINPDWSNESIRFDDCVCFSPTNPDFEDYAPMALVLWIQKHLKGAIYENY